MDLHSSKNKILLKNCIVVKLKQLELMEETESIKDEISYYENLYQILRSDNIDLLITTLKDPNWAEPLQNFNKNVLSISPKELAEKYINLTKSLLTEHNVYSEDKFNELKKAFYKGNDELLKTTSYHSLEEEPKSETFSDYLTENMKADLEELQQLFKQSKNNIHSMTPFGFKSFASELKNLTKNLGKAKLQQAYEKEIQDIEILYHMSENTRPTYQINITLIDDPITQKTHTDQIEEPTWRKNYTQNLCYTYLEAQKYATTEESVLTPWIIEQKMHTFFDSYKKLEEMITKCKMTISGKSIFYSSESSIEPELSLDSESHVIPSDSSPQHNEIEIA